MSKGQNSNFQPSSVKSVDILPHSCLGMSFATETGRIILSNSLRRLWLHQSRATAVTLNSVLEGKGRAMKKFLLVCALCMSFGLASNVLGQGRNNDGRNGIRRGVRSGQLTRDEARQLRQRRRQIRQGRRTYRSDGSYTRGERRDVRRDRRELGRNIRRERRDDDRRRRGNGYYRRGAGSPSHPVFGRRNRNR